MVDLGKASIGNNGTSIISNNVDTSLNLNKIIKQRTRSIELLGGNEGAYDSKRTSIVLRFPEHKTMDSLSRKYDNNPILTIPIRAFVYNKDKLLTGIALSMESYTIYKPDELIERESKKPAIVMLDDTLDVLQSVSPDRPFVIAAINFIPYHTQQWETGYFY